MTTIASASIDAEDTFTDSVNLEGYFNISISGTFVATVFVQRSIDNSTWVDVNSFTAPFEGTGFDPEFMWYRIGVKTGGYTSGTAVVRIGREDKDRH
jgi:hypothetical protein